MSQPRMRPEFRRPLAVEAPVFIAALADALAHPDGPCRGSTFGDAATLRIHREERRVWTPALHLHVEGGADGAERVLHGRFSPSSPVWTAFVGIDIGLTTIAIGSACYGVAQLSLDATPWAFVGVPVALALAGFTYGAAFIGQGLGAEDMYELRSFVDRVADRAAAQSRCARDVG